MGLGYTLENPYIDGAASILIGCVLGSVAAFLVYESKKLLVGEGAERETVEGICEIISQDKVIEAFNSPFTMYLAPKEILLALEVDLKSFLSADEVEGGD